MQLLKKPNDKNLCWLFKYIVICFIIQTSALNSTETAFQIPTLTIFSMLFLTWHFSVNFQLALHDPNCPCLHSASPNQAHTHLAPSNSRYRGLCAPHSCMQAPFQASCQLSSVTIEAPPHFTALVCKLHSKPTLISTWHLYERGKLCSLNMHYDKYALAQAYCRF